MRTREAARREAKKARNKEVREEKAKEKAKEAAKSKGRKSSESKKKRGKAASKTVSQPEPEPAPEAHERTPPLTPPPEIPPEELERCIRDLMEVKAETGLPLNYLLDRGYENLDRERDEMEAEPSQRFTGVYDEGSGEEDAVGADGTRRLNP
ncbi:hypothetical protein PENSPDRAFT_660113 [Peniophora sp. CONT]|nr:hypothetical protein PENSPDRAFT_660113 [Peniophora sp. CONT]